MAKYLDENGLNHLIGKIYDGFSTKNEFNEAILNIQQKIWMITWSELKNLKDSNTLVPGNYYRITDYITTTTQEGTQSAEHQFDIIVWALNESKLSEEAYATQSTGDTYFNTSKLYAWKVWYSLDNDKTRFAWADEVNGKGVIYRMIDEYGNDCPYDFKNIMFVRTADWFAEEKGANWANRVLGYIPNTDKYFYTFDWDDQSHISADYSILANNGSILDDEGHNAGCYNNVVKNVNGYYLNINESSYALPCNVFVSTQYYNGGSSYGVYSNTLKNDCFLNTFGNDCYDNILGNYCFSNTFGNDCYSNIFEYQCRSNTFENNCYENTFGNSSFSNIFRDSCFLNTFGSNCYANTFGDTCSSNTLGDNCESNTFGSNCSSNALGDYCGSNNLGDYCFSNTFGDTCSSNTLGDNCESNTFGNNCSIITFGDTCSSNTLGDNCESNTFGGECKSNTLGYNCGDNTFRDNCRYNTFRDNCKYNTFGDYCVTNTLSTGCYSNNFGDHCISNTFEDDCETNTLGNYCCDNILGRLCYDNIFGNRCCYNILGIDCSSNNLGDTFEDNIGYQYVKYVRFEDYCNNNILARPASQYMYNISNIKYNSDVSHTTFDFTHLNNQNGTLQNIIISSGVKGTNTSRLSIDPKVVNQDYEVRVAMNSSGVLKVYCEADLIN